MVKKPGCGRGKGIRKTKNAGHYRRLCSKPGNFKFESCSKSKKGYNLGTVKNLNANRKGDEEMKTKLITALFLGLILSVFGCKSDEDKAADVSGEEQEVSVPAAKARKSISYTLEIQEEGGDTNRLEYNMEGQKASFVAQQKEGGKFVTKATMIQDGNVTYILNPDEKMAIKFAGDNNPMGAGFPFMQWAVEPDWAHWLKAHEKNPNYSVKEIGKEKIRGEKCRVIELNDKIQRHKVNMYISDDNVIMRWVNLPGQANMKKTTMDLIDYKVDKRIPAEKFQVPKGYTVQDMSKMMIPNMPKR